jgi:hypothetical protein
MALVRSTIRRASRKGRGFATPWGGMAQRRPQRVAMQGRRAGRHSIFSSLLGNCVGVVPAPFGFCESAPDAIRFPDLKGVRSAVTHNGAHLTNSLGTSLSALPFIFAFLSARGEEEMGVVAAAQSDGLPGTVR